MKAIFATAIVIMTSFCGFAQTLNRAEYFFDADPGTGNGTALAITPGATVNQSFNVSTGSLGTGFHTLNTRVRSNAGVWSLFASRTFYIVPPVSALPPSSQITRAEFFFDSDPGIGDATPLSITNSAAVTFSITVPVNSLSLGFHTLNVRVRDNQQRWSLFGQRTFYIVPPVGNVSSTTIKRAEYFLNADPGVGNATPLAITSTNPLNSNFSIDVSSLSAGFHTVSVRVQDNLNRWSHFTNRTFFVIGALSNSASAITKLEYFIDTDPDLNPSVNGTGVAVTPTATLDQNIFIDLNGIPPGAHTLYLRAKDDKGAWSTVRHANFTILNCTPPAPPVANAVSRCGEGVLTLTATGATGTQVYRWYADNTTNTVLFTGSNFTTPNLSATRNYYVSIFDPATTCEGNRTLVTASINLSTKPVVNPSGDISFCEGGFVVLSAPGGFSQYTWSTGETTRQIFVNATGQYSVSVGDGNCTSPVSDPVNVNVIAGPQQPTIAVNGNTTFCGTGSVTLTAPAGFDYVWSTGATTQSITVSQTGVYFVRVRSGNNCLSVASQPVAVTVQTPPCDGNGGGSGINNQAPVISSTPLTSPIEGQVTVDLTKIVTDADANIDYATLRLLSVTTARGASASIDASYNLVIDYKGNPFTGVDRITIEVCDLAGACVQQVLDIEVVGAVVVYNGLTPDGDGKNDFLLLKYIDVVEGADKNKVTIFNRWGDVVFDINDYNNNDRVFTGLNKSGGDLPSGTYFYKVEFAGGMKPLTGFLTLKR